MASTKLNQLRDNYFSGVLNSETNQFLPYYRAKFLYEDIEKLDRVNPTKFRGWLSVLCAEKVLPILLPELPEYIDNQIPIRMINLAKRLCSEQLRPNSWRIVLFEDMYYHLSGGAWGHVDDGEISLAAHLAGLSPHNALRECKGEKSLLQFDDKVIQKLLNTTSPEDGYLDTAGVASVAFSMRNGDIYSKSDMKDFWVWWFTVAIDIAYAYAATH